MLDAIKELYQPEKRQLREDVDGITLRPPYLVGPHGLVILNTKERILHFRDSTGENAFCHIYLDPKISYHFADQLLNCPGLESGLTLEMIRDFRAIIWLFLRLGRFEELFHVPTP
jgi:hypothetical protein